MYPEPVELACTSGAKDTLMVASLVTDELRFRTFSDGGKRNDTVIYIFASKDEARELFNWLGLWLLDRGG